MSSREHAPLDSQALTRRALLAQLGRISAGIAVAPAALSFPNGASQAGTDKPAEEGHVLRASSFPGAPDGRPRTLMGYNRQFPGPLIRVKEGETLRVKVVNELSVPTSVHWHGMHQPGTWTMDGVEEVSRPPIPAGAAFVYEFKAAPFGTHWYHSHVGVQYGDGLLGPLIVEERTPIATYDREEVLILSDWFLQPGEALLAHLVKGMMDMPRDKAPAKDKTPDKMDMKGMKDVGDVPFQSGLINGKGRHPGAADAPLTVLKVTRGETVRLRLINASSTYAFRFQIDGHSLKVIATDGAPVKPIEVDNLVLDVGERYDVLLHAGGEGSAWIRTATLDGNEARAVLRYADGALAPPDVKVKWGERMLMLSALRSPGPVQLAAKPRELPILLGGSMKPFRWSINEQFYPKADPIVLQKDEPVRFVIKNPTRMDHPFHLHGHYFHVLGKPGALNHTDPVQKDTVAIPAKSELVLQWVATNPGRWFFHCHIEWHLATGMARVIEIKPF
jgi:FtsP/CotA-like multicopper oxidase with cupredoxin domain